MYHDQGRFPQAVRELSLRQAFLILLDKNEKPVILFLMIIERTIEINQDRLLSLKLPFALPIGRARMALTIIPEKLVPSVEKNSAFGCMHDFADPSKIADEKGAWERAVLEKYAKN